MVRGVWDCVKWFVKLFFKVGIVEGARSASRNDGILAVRLRMIGEADDPDLYAVAVYLLEFIPPRLSTCIFLRGS